MGTAKNREWCGRGKLRCPSDMTGVEWAYAGPLIPPAKRGDNKRRVDGREVMNGRSKFGKQGSRRVMDILRTGRQWRAIPKDLRAARCSTISTWGPATARWIASITRFMWRAGSKANGRPAPPPPSSIAILRQARDVSVKSAKPFGKLGRGACIDPHGYDAGKKINGEKRHILVDTLGLLLHENEHPADIQDRDGGILCKSRDLRFRALSRESATCHSSLGPRDEWRNPPLTDGSSPAFYNTKRFHRTPRNLTPMAVQHSAAALAGAGRGYLDNARALPTALRWPFQQASLAGILGQLCPRPQRITQPLAA